MTLTTKQLGRIIKKRLRQDKDCVVAITGDEGSGKSVLGIQLGKDIDPKFTIYRNILFSPNKDNVLKKMNDLPRYSCVDADEAIKLLYKLKWSSKFSIFINMVYALCRKENNASLLLIPRYKDLNEFFRNHRVYLWICILERGTAIVFGKDWSPFSDDPWYIDENDRLIKKYTKRKKFFGINLETKITILERSRNFLDVLIWDDLESSEKQEYEKLRDRSKYEDLSESEQTDSEIHQKLMKENIKLILFIKKKLKLTDKIIGELIGISADAIKQRRLRAKKSRNKGTE